MLKYCLLSFSLIIFSLAHNAWAGKLLGASGGATFEGAAGGGLVPWAIIAGDGTQDELGAAVNLSLIEMDDFSFSSVGAAFGFYNRIEVSFAHASAQADEDSDVIRQDIVGLKARLFGDLIFGDVPQVALGLQYKQIGNSFDVASLGADDSRGLDVYLVVTKLWLDGFFSRNTLFSAGVRASKANEMGFFGFSNATEQNDDYELLGELALGLFLNRHYMVGTEYRQKPSNLNNPEEDWQSVFLSYIPQHNLSITLAWMNAGRIGEFDEQQGVYLSLKGAF